MKRTVIVIVLFLAACLVHAAGRLERYRDHVQCSVAGFDESECVTAGDETICQCAINDPYECDFVFLRDNKEYFRWPSGGGVNSSLRSFEVLKGDFDGDRQDEIAIASEVNASQGIAITYWMISVFKTPVGCAPPLIYCAEDYGPKKMQRRRL